MRSGLARGHLLPGEWPLKGRLPTAVYTTNDGKLHSGLPSFFSASVFGGLSRSLFLGLHDAPLHDQRMGAKLMGRMVEEQPWVEATALEDRLKMQMLRRGTTCTACTADHLARLHPLTLPHMVARLVAIVSLQAIKMADHDIVSIPVIRS